MEIKQDIFGTTPEGAETKKFTISNDNGITASFINLGAISASLRAPDRNGKTEATTLGFDTLNSNKSLINYYTGRKNKS
jgi:aldose 1-epimerase